MSVWAHMRVPNGWGLVWDRPASRWRALARYKFGPAMHGWTLGLAISF